MRDSESASKAAFAGKKAVVTGAAGNLGRAVAQAFHEAGAEVLGIDLAAQEAPWPIATADLIDPAAARRVIADAGDIHILANIAGGFAMGEQIADTSDQAWDFMLNLNARTVLNACRAAVPGMVARGGGKIVNIGARGALRGAALMGAYIASKSLVMRLTETLAEELKHQGLNVNCILPSIIDTPQNRAAMPDANFAHWVRPSDIARVVLFLCSPAASAIHGAAIPVEGLS